MNQYCSCKNNCITNKDNLDFKIKSINQCNNCQDIHIKKFSPIMDFKDFNQIDKSYGLCECRKRPIDVVMAHILKIMVENDIVGKNATLRHDSPVPLSGFYYSNLNPQFIGENMLILLHSDFTENVAENIINEVPEVKGILKGSPATTVSQLDKNSNVNHFELLAGCDIQSNIIRTLINDKIILNKRQSKNHIEVATTTEEKIMRLHNYLENNNIKKGIALDGLCGGGALGIYLLKYGFEKVIFNDIYSEAIKTLKCNMEVNGIYDNFKIYNESFEDLNVNDVDLCVIDAFPNVDISQIYRKAEKIANNVVVI